MSWHDDERARAYGDMPYVYQQQLRAMHHVMQMTSNAGFADFHSDGVMHLRTDTNSIDLQSSSNRQSNYEGHAGSSHTSINFPAASAYQSTETSSPQSSFTNSSSTSPYDAEDAMLDAAMLESGILTSVPMDEEDDTLLRDMDHLLACSDAAQLEQAHLESPTLEFPRPVTPSSFSAGVTASHSHASHEGDASDEEVAASNPWPPEIDDTDMEEAFEDDHVESPADAREKELMERQLKFLKAQKDFLEYKTAVAKSMDQELTEEEVDARDKATAEEEKLNAAQLQHKLLGNISRELQENYRYIELLLLQSPLNNYRMTLMSPMECFIHLTKDLAERRATLLALRDSKIDDVMRYINYQSRNIDLERQFFYLDTFEKFGKFYTVDFSISKLEDTTVDEVVHIIYHHFASSNQVISEILGSVENRDYFDAVRDIYIHARFVDRITLPKREKDDRRFVVQESNCVYYIKKVGETFVFACDYVDKDELHPYRQSGRIRQDKTIGVIVEPYIDSHGNQTVIMKRYAFIKHHFKTVKPTPDLVQAISTKVILWGQAVRFCLAGHVRSKARASQISTKLLAKSEEITKIVNSKSE